MGYAVGQTTSETRYSWSDGIKPPDPTAPPAVLLVNPNGGISINTTTFPPFFCGLSPMAVWSFGYVTTDYFPLVCGYDTRRPDKMLPSISGTGGVPAVSHTCTDNAGYMCCATAGSCSDVATTCTQGLLEPPDKVSMKIESGTLWCADYYTCTSEVMAKTTALFCGHQVLDWAGPILATPEFMDVHAGSTIAFEHSSSIISSDMFTTKYVADVSTGWNFQYIYPTTSTTHK